MDETEPGAKAPPDRLARLIERMDRPLLGLAILSMGLYLLDLHGLMGWARGAYLLANFAIDSIFLVDLLLKLRVQGASYARTPWFLIDLLSCLPLLDVVASGIPGLRAVRFVRGFRVLRILRGLRVLRALRTIPAFDEFFDETQDGGARTNFHRAINVAMIALTATVLITVVLVRRQIALEYVATIDAVIASPISADRLEDLRGSTSPPPHAASVERAVRVDGREVRAYFDLSPVDDRANEIEFFLILGMLFSMILFMYILAYHQLDITQEQLRALLSLALPGQLVRRFLVDPTAYTAKVRRPATIVFMDFHDFTETCERLAHAPDVLAAHMERAMERLVVPLSRHDMILDKFIGDAVMSFRGGPLVDGEPDEHAYRAVRASLDCIRELKALDDPYFSRVKIGGASASDCLIGSFGTSRRLSYTVLGDGVNLAARLEPACGQCEASNLFCARTRRLCEGKSDLVWRRWGRVRVRGKAEPVEVHEALDADDLGDRTFLETFRRALAAFERGDLPSALDGFHRSDAERPGGDGPSRCYARWCQALLAAGPPPGWEPVFQAHK